MSGWLTAVPLVGDLLGIVSEAVTDKDKRNEINFKIAELAHNFQMELVRSQTVPWVDALVKLIYALVALAAPLGTALMSAVGIYAHIKGVDLGTEVTHGAIDSSFLLWRAARHREKMQGVAIPSVPASTAPRRMGPPR